MFKKLSLTAITILVFAFTSLNAHSGNVPILKSRTVVSKDIVTIGDLFHHAGEFASIPVFQSPDPGVVGTVGTQSVLDAVRKHGIAKVDSQGLAEIIVLRADNVITKADIENTIIEAFHQKFDVGTIGDLEISYDQPVQDLPTQVFDAELRVEDARYQRMNGKFSVKMVYKASENEAEQSITYTGAMLEMVDAPILISAKRRGEILQPSDLSFERHPVNKVGKLALTHIEDLTGMELRRSMRVGSMITERDIKRPTLVSRNDIVSVIYSHNGLTLTTRGRALDSGAKGDMVTILNGQSKSTLQAMVRDRGQVLVTSAAF